MITRAEVIAAARRYVGMNFGAQGRGRPGDASAHIDCAGLVVCVAFDLGIRDRYGVALNRSDYADHGIQEHNSFLPNELKRRMIEHEAPPIVGDVLIFRAPIAVAHCGIVSDFPASQGGLGLIFAYPVRIRAAVLGKIVEVRLDERWRSRIAGILSFPGVG